MNKITKALSLAAVAILPLLNIGCSSIVHSGNRSVTVNSVPPGAKATVRKSNSQETVHVGTTPMTVSLTPNGGYFKGQSYTIDLEMPGYQTQQIAVSPTVSGWYFGNIVFGGLIGMLIVDPMTGSMWNLSPESVSRELPADQAALLESGDGFVVMLVADATEAERAQMVRVR